ncbi:MAG: glycosyltransferase family 39 protein [Armatimonadetes bacterium]|nr:glycosyltransferase family 39 protein [Armatimonadota bacterium]MDE2205449.1 glycosyltransferase family 39 protein [Armatimonadota bacterium]
MKRVSVPVRPTSAEMQQVWRGLTVLLFGLFLVCGIWHAAVAPVGQTGYQDAPDEAAHVNYARALSNGGFPTAAEARRDPRQQSYEWHQPPLYYAVAAVFLHFGYRAARVASIVCGLLTLALIVAAVRLIWPGRGDIAVAALAFAAALPGNIAISSAVNNDAMLEMWFSAVLLCCILGASGGFSVQLALITGLCLGAALLTKATSLLLVPIIAVALAMAWRRRHGRREVMLATASVAGVAFAISGWWFVRSMIIYHELLPLRAFNSMFGGTVQARDVAAGKLPGLGVENWGGYAWLVCRWSFKSFWAVYGVPRSAVIGAPVFLPAQVYVLALGICLACFAGLVKMHQFRNSQPQIVKDAMALMALTIGAVAFSFAVFLSRYFQAQGRYLYPAILPMALLGGFGWTSVFPDRYRGAGVGGLCAVLGLFCIALFIYATPH